MVYLILGFRVKGSEFMLIYGYIFCVQVSGCEHTIVVYEVVLSLLRLVRKYAHSLHCAEWDVIYSILSNVQRHAAELDLKLPNSLVKVRRHIHFSMLCVIHGFLFLTESL